jgi:hypothetical protein
MSDGSPNDLDANDTAGFTVNTWLKRSGCASNKNSTLQPSVVMMPRQDDSYRGSSLEDEDEEDDYEGGL